ncbi:MAG: hypothetical protein BWZ10_00927 [candidate division BRC1 bacterium ADurb.BinA364]|nr:MAG: hypothetical protein BWZ10_00927 [candidate division BRC1 bacterium ADurb.BinA364]
MVADPIYSEIVVIAAVLVLAAYVMFSLNLFKKG